MKGSTQDFINPSRSSSSSFFLPSLTICPKFPPLIYLQFLETRPFLQEPAICPSVSSILYRAIRFPVILVTFTYGSSKTKDSILKFSLSKSTLHFAFANVYIPLEFLLANEPGLLFIAEIIYCALNSYLDFFNNFGSNQGPLCDH